MSNKFIVGNEIHFRNPDPDASQVNIKSDKKIQFTIGGNDVFEITGSDVSHEVSATYTTTQLSVNGTDDALSSSDTTAPIYCSGGAAIEKAVFCGTTLEVDGVATFNDTTASTSSTTGSVVLAGGLGVAGDIFGAGSISVPKGQSVYVGEGTAPGDDRIRIHCFADDGYLDYGADSLFVRSDNSGADTMIHFNGNSSVDFKKRLLVDDTTEATNTTDGSLQTDGGISCAKSLYVGVDIDYVGILTDVSDKRIKSNIQAMGDVLHRLKNVKPCSFDIELDECKEKKRGFIAQELEEVFPELVVQKPTTVNGKVIEDFRRVREVEMLPFLVKAVQELDDKVEAGKNVEVKYEVSPKEIEKVLSDMKEKAQDCGYDPKQMETMKAQILDMDDKVNQIRRKGVAKADVQIPAAVHDRLDALDQKYNKLLESKAGSDTKMLEGEQAHEEAVENLNNKIVHLVALLEEKEKKIVAQDTKFNKLNATLKKVIVKLEEHDKKFAAADADESTIAEL